MNELEILKKKIADLEAWKKSLEASKSIPLNVDRALRERLSNLSSLFLKSTKGADTEDETVDEGGVGIYAVMKDPDGFLETTINGTKYYIPYFD